MTENTIDIYKARLADQTERMPRLIWVFTGRTVNLLVLSWGGSNYAWSHRTYEPPHDKTNKVALRPAKPPVSLGIRPDWSESSLCAQRIAKDPSFLHADSEDSAQTGWNPQSDLSLRWAHMLFCWFCREVAYFISLVTDFGLDLDPRAFLFRNMWIMEPLWCGQRRLWSDWADAQTQRLKKKPLPHQFWWVDRKTGNKTIFLGLKKLKVKKKKTFL